MSQTVFNDPKFQQWKQRVEANGNIIKNVKVLAEVSRSGGSLYGVFLDCRLITPEGMEVPRCVLIRGDSVVIVPLLRCMETGEIHTLMVEQRRVIDGGLSQEFPAGAVNVLCDDHRAIACRELQEELHLSVSPEELIPLTTRPVKIITSLVGDYLYYFYFEKDVSLAFLREIDGRRTGCHEEHEHIRVRVSTMAEVASSSTSSCLIAVKLLERALGRAF